MTPIDPAQLVTAILGILAIVGVTATVAWKAGKRVLGDVTDILVNSNAAAQNGQLTPAEATAILNDINDIANAIEGVITVVPTPKPTPAPAPQPAATVKPTV